MSANRFLLCPVCQHPDSRMETYKTVPLKIGIRRYRKCTHCTCRKRTVERDEPDYVSPGRVKELLGLVG